MRSKPGRKESISRRWLSQDGRKHDGGGDQHAESEEAPQEPGAGLLDLRFHYDRLAERLIERNTPGNRVSVREDLIAVCRNDLVRKVHGVFESMIFAEIGRNRRVLLLGSILGQISQLDFASNGEVASLTGLNFEISEESSGILLS